MSSRACTTAAAADAADVAKESSPRRHLRSRQCDSAASARLVPLVLVLVLVHKLPATTFQSELNLQIKIVSLKILFLYLSHTCYTYQTG